MIRDVTLNGASWNDLPWKVEAGTPPIAQGIGVAAALTYLQELDMAAVQAHAHALVGDALEQLQQVPDVEVYGPEADKRGGVIAFNMRDMHPHDIASILDEQGVAIRAGHHCAMPLMGTLGLHGACRASFYVYNTPDEIDILLDSLGEVRRILR